MSVKAMSLVWDIPCPSSINGFDFKPGHKYILIAYADHADQNGRNIYPAVKTVAQKTGYDERSVQRITKSLEDMGILINDGCGPRGTNRWYIPFSKGGDKITPLTILQGGIQSKSLGDIPSGDIPSGDNLTPEFKELNQKDISLYKQMDDVWGDTKQKLRLDIPKASFETWIDGTSVIGFDGHTLIIGARNAYARDWLEKKIKDKAQEISGYFVVFATQSNISEEMDVE